MHDENMYHLDDIAVEASETIGSKFDIFLSIIVFEIAANILRKPLPSLFSYIFYSIFLQINRAKGILDTILSDQPKDSSSGKAGETGEVIVFKIAEEMLRKNLPRQFSYISYSFFRFRLTGQRSSWTQSCLSSPRNLLAGRW